jgi:beta-glucosidase
MLGAEGGNALADVLFGDVVPSGHLTFVWGPEANYPSVALTDVSGDPLITKSIVYEEGLFVGQRYFEKNNKEYDYPFGYGLSYTTFSFSDLSLSMKKKGLTVKFKVKNNGKYKGKVVPMVFLKFPIDNYPEKVFKGFDKKSIKSGSSSSFEIVIEDHDLSYYDVSKKDYVRPTSGDFTVYVGENARDIQLTKTIGANY